MFLPKIINKYGVLLNAIDDPNKMLMDFGRVNWKVCLNGKTNELVFKKNPYEKDVYLFEYLFTRDDEREISLIAIKRDTRISEFFKEFCYCIYNFEKEYEYIPNTFKVYYSTLSREPQRYHRLHIKYSELENCNYESQIIYNKRLRTRLRNPLKEYTYIQEPAVPENSITWTNNDPYTITYSPASSTACTDITYGALSHDSRPHI